MTGSPGDKTEVQTGSVTVSPVAVTVIDTGHAPNATLASGMVGTTPDGLPNLLVTAVTPLLAIAVRAGNTFLVFVAGLVTAGLTPEGAKLLQPSDFYHLVLTASALAVAPVGIGIIKDLVTIFGRLESKYPLLTGSV